jgi:tetratricopeptide (TPR) repeat protein
MIEQLWWGKAEVEEVTSVEIEVADELVEQEARQPEIAAPRRLPPRAARWLKRPVVFLPALALILLPALGFWLYSKRAEERRLAEITLPRVAGRKPVAVMHFENRSGNRELDWLREGLADMLIANLSRSPKLAVLSRQQLHVLLDRAGRARDGQIPLEDALEIARKTQAEVIALGSFAWIGERVRLDVQLHDARTGQLLTAESLIADKPEQILSQVDLLSLKLAGHLNASPADQQPRLADVMTGNLEAYRYYSLALEKIHAFHSLEAIDLLEKAIALDDRFAMAYARLGYVYLLGGFSDETGKTKRYLEKAYQLTRHLAERDRLYITVWYSFANQGDDNTIRALREIIHQYPLDVEAYYLLSYTLRNEARLEEAVEVIRQGLMVDAEAPDLYNRLGFCYAELGRYDEARAAHERYVQLAPREANAYDSLGMILNEMGRFEDALAAFDRALALSPGFGLAAMHKGDVYFRQGRYREALDQYQRSLPLIPASYHRATAYQRLARLHLKKGDLRRAEEAARQELRNLNGIGAFLVAVARGDLDAAEKLRTEYLDPLGEKRAPAILAKLNEYCRGLLALKRGRAAEAVEYFRSATRRLPLSWNVDSAVEDCLADAYLELGQLDEAITEYERILRLNPNYPLAHYHLGQAYERKGDRDRARVAYERFLQIWAGADPDIPEVMEAKRRVEN